jgi:hypothetical protein
VVAALAIGPVRYSALLLVATVIAVGAGAAAFVVLPPT